MKTFRCDFGSGVICEMQVSEGDLLQGAKHIQKIVWSKKPRPEMLRPYIDWVNSVNQTLADTYGKKIMHVFGIDKLRSEVWTCTPGGKPERIFPPAEPLKNWNPGGMS